MCNQWKNGSVSGIETPFFTNTDCKGSNRWDLWVWSGQSLKIDGCVFSNNACTFVLPVWTIPQKSNEINVFFKRAQVTLLIVICYWSPETSLTYHEIMFWPQGTGECSGYCSHCFIINSFHYFFTDTHKKNKERNTKHLCTQLHMWDVAASVAHNDQKRKEPLKQLSQKPRMTSSWHKDSLFVWLRRWCIFLSKRSLPRVDCDWL